MSVQAHKLKQLIDQGATFIYADQAELPAFMAKGTLFIRIPEGDSASFAHEMLTFCLDHQVDYVYPLRKKEIIALAEARQLFEEYHIKVIVPAKPQNICYSSSVPVNGTILVLYHNFNLLKNEMTGVDKNIGTGVFVVGPHDDELRYCLYTAD